MQSILTYSDCATSLHHQTRLLQNGRWDQALVPFCGSLAQFFLAMADTEETPILKVQAQCKRWKWCRWLAISWFATIETNGIIFISMKTCINVQIFVPWSKLDCIPILVDGHQSIFIGNYMPIMFGFPWFPWNVMDDHKPHMISSWLSRSHCTPTIFPLWLVKSHWNSINFSWISD